MPGRSPSGIASANTSTPRLIQIASEDRCTARATVDFPDRGVPFRTTMVPGPVPATVPRSPVQAVSCFGIDCTAGTG